MSAPLSALEWLRVTHADTLSGRRIEQAVAEARAEGRLEGVLHTMSLVERVVRLAPWGAGDPLKIRDDLLHALEPGAEVPS